jgi:ring-1,2-phenylacetyl-CoA epoxidase subunit PaaE
MVRKYPLPVSNIKRLTEDAVVVSFDIPDELKEEFKFKAGQYITFIININGEQVRRAYSLCSSPDEDKMSVGVKRIPNGKMSTYLNRELKEGEIVQVITPKGRFFIETNEDHSKHYVGLCAGSGLTPILSMLKKVLKDERDSKFSLLYGNKTLETTMFVKELNDLKNEYPERLRIYNAYSRQEVKDSLHGRLDKRNIELLFSKNPDLASADGYYLCGPAAMLDDIDEVLQENNTPKSDIHYERFTAKTKKKKLDSKEVSSEVTVIVDGDEFKFNLPSNSDSILDAAMNQGADVPFSCKGGVCCTCKAKVISGKVDMSVNYSLSEEEVEEGFILTCQAHPKSERVVVDYDVM